MSDQNPTNIVITASDQTGPAFKSATGNLKGLGTTGATTSQQLSQSGAAFLQSLQRQVDSIGKTRGELVAMQAQQLGVAAAAAPLIAKLQATDQTMGKVGVSAAQTANALRGVPAQFTDIVTSLQGGQAPLTVFLQQGGQLKDMFGGAGPAARALGGYISGLISPLTLTAAAVGLLIAAYYTATERTQAYNKALVASGNYVGQTAGSLDDLSKKISGTIGTQGQAADALTALASSGKVAGDSLQTVATAVVAQNKAMGTSVEEAVAQYVKLADEPAKASAKLNESMHYLDLATYERIRTLQDEGKQEEATALAQTSLANASVARMQQVQSQAGLLSKSLSGVKDVALGMWNAVASGLAAIGAGQSAAEKLADAQKKVAFLQQNGSTPQALSAAKSDVTNLSREALRAQDNAYAQSEKSRSDTAKIAASDRLETQRKATRTAAERRKDEIDQLKLDAKTVGLAQDEYDKRLADINAKYKDPKSSQPKAYQDDAGTKMLEQLREQNAAMQVQLGTTDKLTTADQERAKFEQLISDLKGKSQLTADQKSLLAAQDKIKAQLDVNVATEAELESKKKSAELDKQKAAALKQVQQLIEATNIRIEDSLKNQGEQYDRQLGVIGLGSRAAEQQQSGEGIRREFANMKTQLTKQFAKTTDGTNLLGSPEYADEVKKIQTSLDQALAAHDKYYSDLKDMQGDWVNGARAATQNYLDDVQNVAKSTQSAFDSAYRGIEDGLTSFLTTGKANAADIGKQLAAEIVRPLVRQNFTGPLAQYVQGLLPGKDSDPLGDFIGKLGGGTAAASTSTTALATSASAASSAVASLAAAALAAARAMGGSSVSGLGGAGSLFGGSASAFTSAANAMPGDSLDNLFALTGNFASFDVGSDYVEKDMFARVHKGEAIVRAADNVKGASSSRGGDTYQFTVGDVATVSLLKKALAQSQRQVAAGIARSRKYGGGLAP